MTDLMERHADFKIFFFKPDFIPNKFIKVVKGLLRSRSIGS